MRVLSVATAVPYPPDHATRSRTWSLLRRLQPWAEVTLLTWSDAGPPPELEGAVERLVLQPLRPTSARLPARVRRWGGALAGGPPPWIQAVREERGIDPQGPTTLPEEVRALHADAPFDVVVAEEDAAAFLLPDLGVPVVIHRHNVFSPTLRALRHGPRRLAWPLEAPVWRRFDRQAAQADVLVAPTEELARELRSLAPETRVAVVPNVVEPPAEPLDPTAGAGIVFVGTMGYAPNALAVRWFLHRIWPGVRREAPEARFVVIGAGARERFRDADGVDVLGYAPDLVQACAGARLGVVPLREGMGIKTKTLELLGMGLPVVATSIGAEGIAPNEGLLVADDPEAFRGAVLRLLAEPEEAAARGRVGRTFTRERFGGDAAARVYRTVLTGAVEGARRTGVGG